MLRHLAEQQKQLAVVDPEAAAIASCIIEDEQLHHDRSLDQMEMVSAWLSVL